ncbi:MAG: hypothetical protein HY201_01415 [Nitrospirae bacterium]|nr:hypothetical protein [Candidatus Troglogloeales bacterium]
MIRLLWRVFPIFILLYTLRGTAAEYGKYFTMAKQASQYAMTYMNLSQYVALLQTYYTEHGNPPPDLSSFLRSNFNIKGHDPSLDYWDNPYQLIETENQFSLTSCGADKRCPTEDDLSQW